MHSKADAWGNKRGDNKEKASKRGTKDSYNKKKKNQKISYKMVWTCPKKIKMLKPSILCVWYITYSCKLSHTLSLKNTHAQKNLMLYRIKMI